ncbi:MAG: 3-oxoacyl-ACP reductase FabG [Dehalococcoidales bacterium]|nr:3-oxoacyl-ACP reductase FabG [Dehalococcoidales bacterium]
MRLENKVALVTGASRGIGRAIALAYAREGADLVINYAKSADEADSVVKEVKQLGRRAIAVKADVSDDAAINAMTAATVKEFGRIDVLVNNAGVGVVSPSISMEISAWRKCIDILLTGVFACSQTAAKEMIKQGGGKIVNISSVNGMTGIPERAAYCSAKAGVINLTRVLGAEWARYNIRVNTICPGFTKTEMVGNLIARGLYHEDDLLGMIPLNRLGKPEDMGGAAVFLASDESDFITGQTIVIDGGWLSYGYLESYLKRTRK